MSIYDNLATPIRALCDRLPRVHASFADIDEVDVCARALVALYDQVQPQRPVGDFATQYWEDRIALMLVMVEACWFIALRQRDPIVLDCLDALTVQLESLLSEARAMRLAVQHARLAPKEKEAA